MTKEELQAIEERLLDIEDQVLAAIETVQVKLEDAGKWFRESLDDLKKDLRRHLTA